MKENALEGVEKIVKDYRNSEITTVKNSFIAYLYNVIVGSLQIDGCTITLQEARVLFDCGVVINGMSGDESRCAKSLRNAYLKMVDYAENKKNFSVDELQGVANVMMSGCDSYEQCNKLSFINGYLHLADNALTAYKENCNCNCCKNNEPVASKLVDLCEVLNSEIAMIQSDDFQRQYELSCWAHNMVLKHGLWGEFSGRMARLVMHRIQLTFNIPITHFGKDKENYLEAVGMCAQQNDFEPLKNVVRKILLHKTMDDLIRFGGYVASTRLKVAKKPGRKRIELPVEAIYDKLCENNKLTARRIAMEMGLEQQHVVRALNELKVNKRIEHVGSNKCGYWVVID